MKTNKTLNLLLAVISLAALETGCSQSCTNDYDCAGTGYCQLEASGDMYSAPSGYCIGYEEAWEQYGQYGQNGGSSGTQDNFWASKGGAYGNSDGNCTYTSLPNPSGSGSPTFVSSGCGLAAK